MVFLFLLIIIIVLLLIFPLKMGISAYTDLSRRTFIISGYLYGIHIIKVRFYFENSVLLYSLNGRRCKELSIEKIEKDIKVLKLIDHIKIKDVSINFRYGALNNPFKTAVLLATINEGVKMLYARLNASNFSYNALPNFDTQCLTANIDIKLNITLLKLIIDFLKTNKEKVYE